CSTPLLWPAKVVVRSRLTAPFGPMRPAQAAAGCVVSMSAAAIAAKPARNRRIPASSPALGRECSYDAGCCCWFLGLLVPGRPKPSLRGGGPPGLGPVPHRAGALGRPGETAHASAKARRHHREEDQCSDSDLDIPKSFNA